jgi:hypothetical protein
VKALTYFLLPLRWIKYPAPGLPGRLMAHVLGVPARQHDHPMAVLVLLEVKHRRVLQIGPSVRVAFAFGRLLG